MASEVLIPIAAGGRRERRKAETRARLLAAARDLFVERGYHAARPQDIARAADLAAGTFYVHFADKRDAFLAVTDQAAGELMARVKSRVREGAGLAEQLYASLEALLEYSDENPGVLRAVFADEAVIAAGAGTDRGTSLRDRLAQSLAHALRRGMRRGELHADGDPLLLAYAIVGLIQQALAYGAQAGIERRRLLEDVTRFCGRALERGAAPEETST